MSFLLIRVLSYFFGSYAPLTSLFIYGFLCVLCSFYSYIHETWAADIMHGGQLKEQYQLLTINYAMKQALVGPGEFCCEAGPNICIFLFFWLTGVF